MTAFKTSKIVGMAALGSLLVALPALGQDAEVAEEIIGEVIIEDVPVLVKYILDSFIMVLGGILVFWMAAGFTMLEAGFVRTKNVSMQLLKNVTLYSTACIAYYLIGYQIMYPADWTIPGLLGDFGIAVL